MAVGLELRVPFCDHRLVEYAFNIPWEMKTYVADTDAPVRPLLDLARVEDTFTQEVSKVSPLHERMGMERVVGMNSWLAEYDVSVDI